MKIHYDCSKCPGYCCSYPHIEVQSRDLKRLAKHFDISKKEARERFTEEGTADEEGEKPPRIMRHQDDENFGSICHLYDHEKGGCSIYEARPEICRDYPGRARCGYYEFLKFERSAQEDPEYIAVTGN